MRVLDVRWLTGRSCIGVARVETDYDGIEYRIAACQGFDEPTDIKFIADWGTLFPQDAGDVLFGVRKCQAIS